MLKTFQYRLYPTKGQIRLLTEQVEECRWLWNTLLGERQQAWEERQETVDYYAQKAQLPVLKAGARPALKAAWALRHEVAVDPADTSQDCSGCGHRKTDLTRADRLYHCLACGLIMDRDLNAALNILARGRACLGLVL